MKQYEVLIKITDVHKVYIEAADDADEEDIKLQAMQKLNEASKDVEYVREDVDVTIDNVYE